MYSIPSEMIEPFAASFLARLTMNVIDAAEKYGATSCEVGHHVHLWQYGVDGLKKISHAAEGAVHLHLALSNEIRAAKRLIEVKIGKPVQDHLNNF